MPNRVCLAFFALLLGLPAQSTPLTDAEKIHHVLSRLTFGPRPGDFKRVESMGYEAWVKAQLGKARETEDDWTRRRGRFPTLGLSGFEQEASYKAKAQTPEAMEAFSRNEFDAQVVKELKDSIVLRALHREAQLEEVLMDFWRNHFNVDVSKDGVGGLATHWEEAVLRAHALHRFSDFLMATAKHPAMLVYLDNHISRAPPPEHELREIEREMRRRTGSRELAKEQAEIAKQRGLNENYARELMELHTLGVDNGYTQADVVQVAQALTGWSIDREVEGTGFAFKPEMHAFGRKRLMGRPLPDGKREAAIKTGEAVIESLARHDNTADFIAMKLVRWLVNDEAPAAIVSAAAKTFKKTKGDLSATVTTILLHEEFFSREHYRAKFKTPLEFVVSALRATNAEVDDPQYVHEMLYELRMPIYRCEDPTGYRDLAESWRDPGVMALRWRFAIDLALGKKKGLRIPDTTFYGLPEDPIAIADLLIQRIVPAGLGEATRAVLERVVFQTAVEEGVKTEKERLALARKVTGILLGSPEFQQQ